MLGPLANPAGAQAQLVGVYDAALTEPVARVLRNLGVRRALVVCSRDGLDEISASAPTCAAELKDGEIRAYEIAPEDYGFEKSALAEVRGEGPERNAAILRALLKGEKGPKRDVLLLNAGAAVYVGKGAPTLAKGVERAREALDSGAAHEKLERLVAFTNGAKENAV